MTSTTIESLPAELLSQIFLFVDTPAPSDHRLHDQPSADLLRQSTDDPQPLKTISLVNTLWRATVLPLLFRNVVWYVDRLDDPSAAIPLLPFLRENHLAPYVRTVTLVVSDHNNSNSSSSSSRDVDVGLYRRGDGTGQYGYSPDPISPIGDAEKHMIFHKDYNWLWHYILDVVNPLRFTIIASPRMLAALMSRMLYLGDEWSFDQTHHILSLSRDSVATTTTTTTTTTATALRQSTSIPTTPTRVPASARSPSCDLFTLAPWTHLLLNEGSSTRVYKTYEYYHKRPPSILPALLGSDAPPNDQPLIPPSIRDVSYVAIFPLANHLHASLVSHLPHGLDRLFVQVVPRNEILRDRAEMDHLDMDDLWAERNTVYADILPRLVGDLEDDSSGSEEGEGEGEEGTDGWASLRVFESGDAADRESWEMAVEYVTAPRGAGEAARWTVEREGLFVRATIPREDTAGSVV